MAHLIAVKADDLIRAIERYASRTGIGYRSEAGKGSHRKIWLGASRSVVPVHRGDLPTGTYRAILRQLGIAESDLKD
jgi:predicted RNA binding protein YcfA (HicA-like mRNA interferase family)